MDDVKKWRNKMIDKTVDVEEFADNMDDLLAEVLEEDATILIETNGEGNVVLISEEQYEDLTEISGDE